MFNPTVCREKKAKVQRESPQNQRSPFRSQESRPLAPDRWLETSGDWPPPPSYVAVKSALDFLAASVMIALAIPLMALAAALVKLTSRGPMIYSQVRLGRFGRPYHIYKIRTMVHDCEKHSGARWCTTHDPRITWVGRFLRRTHLDELPQLWNVIRGDMSLIGPRPERPEFVPTLQGAIPYYLDRLQVRPGVTGLAQVQLPADTDLESVRRKLAYDLYYVRNVSFWLDFRILVCTAFKVLGVPFDVLRSLFRMPSRLKVEMAYHKIGGPAKISAQMNMA